MFLYYLVGTLLLLTVTVSWLIALYGLINYHTLPILRRPKKQRMRQAIILEAPVIGFLSLSLFPDVVQGQAAAGISYFFWLGVFTVAEGLFGIVIALLLGRKRKKYETQGRVTIYLPGPSTIFQSTLLNFMQIAYAIIALAILL